MKSLLVLTACMLSLTGFCQKKDYLIKNNGDTIWGEISVKNKMVIVDGANPVAISPQDISRIRSEKYKGNIVISCKLENYADNLNDLDIDFIKRGAIDTVLILKEIYSTPRMNLYEVKDNIGMQFYFYKTPSDPKPVQLVIHYFFQGGLTNYSNDPGRFRGEKQKIYVVEDKGYVNQLQAIMADCKNIPPTMWELLTYRNYSLKQLIKKYNKCK